MRNIRAALVGFGEVNTPAEFITDRVAAVTGQLRERGVDVFAAQYVSDDPEGKNPARAAAELAGQDFDALIVCVAGWIPTWAVIKTIENFRHKPVLLWGLSGWYRGETFVTTADQAGTTALRKVLEDLGFNFQYLVNFKDAPPRFDEAVRFLQAARAGALLREALIGMNGYRDMRLYGTLYDGNLLKRDLGVEIEHFDLLEIQQLMAEIAPAAVAKEVARIEREWAFTRAPQPGTLENSVRLALALQQKLAERHYAGFSFCDVDGIKRLLKFAPAGSMALLHELCPELVSVPENDAYGTVTALLMKYLTQQIPAYLEFYEFTENSALMGVPDYVPPSVVAGKVTVMPNRFGSFGEGLLNVSKLKTGAVTIVRLTQAGNRFAMHAATGTAQTPPAWEEAGWAPPAPQLPSLEVVLDGGSEEFLQQVMGQHYILAYGNHLPILRDFCNLHGIELIEAGN